ncbi:hypothetical protein [Streptomyces cadmiisoli]|uniref:hypothetical protein n=1 Tax=Streptomyces cadmiisoli TaxID=2184053 RepID=UPI0013A6A526|nr:hypothetical protein [Streptomyces cadmiisoli]
MSEYQYYEFLAVSEYQYYEFLAVDRSLDAEQLQQVRALSTRARISSTRFVNEYHWGDFRGDSTKLVEQLYDAHLYYANWGSRRLLLRLPATVLPAKKATAYARNEALTVWSRSGHTLLDFSRDGEHDEEWEFETSAELSSLIGLRAELAAGDLRPLYLAWLAALSVRELDDDEGAEYAREMEPPIPYGLSQLTGPQRALVDFLEVDTDLLTAAAQVSEPRPSPDGPQRHELTAFIAALPVQDKDDLLLAAALGTGPQPGPEPLPGRSPRPGHPANPVPQRRRTPRCRPAPPHRTRPARTRGPPQSHRETRPRRSTGLPAAPRPPRPQPRQGLAGRRESDRSEEAHHLRRGNHPPQGSPRDLQPKRHPCRLRPTGRRPARRPPGQARLDAALRHRRHPQPLIPVRALPVPNPRPRRARSTFAFVERAAEAVAMAAGVHGARPCSCRWMRCR